MRILILSNLYPNPWQPHRAAFNRQQFAALARQHDVRIVAPVAWTDQWHSREIGRHERTVLRDGILIEHPPYFFPPRVLRSWHGHFYQRCVRPTFVRAVEQYQPEVLLASWAYPDAWAAVELARETNLPVIAKVHGSDVLMLNQYPARQQRTTDALRSADAVIAVSRHLASSVEQVGVDRDRIHVVYNGIDTNLFCPGRATASPPSPRSTGEREKDGSPPMVLFIGNLVPVKALETLIDACADLHDRGVAFQCCLIGQGPLEQSLSRQIAEKRLSPQVQLIGPRRLEELPDWYRAASVFVLSSRSEGIPNVILEALACGTPVVAPNVGGIPEVLDERSLVPPGDVLAMSHAIERALVSPIASSATFQPGSWESSATKLAEVLACAIAARRKAAA